MLIITIIIDVELQSRLIRLAGQLVSGPKQFKYWH